MKPILKPTVLKILLGYISCMSILLIFIFRVTSKIDLFGGDALGIFTNADKLEVSTQTKTWEKLQNRDLRLAVTHPPSNYFQQMILWTEEGKIWKFPIDNEQGIVL